MRAADLVPLVLAFLAFKSSRPSGSSSSSSRGAGAPGPSTPGTQVRLLRTGDPDPVTWGRRRLALLVATLTGGLEPPMAGPLADRVARTILAQWAHETARGASEFNFNLGGWTARRGDDFHTANDRLSGATGFRWTAYPDLPTAVVDQVRRLALTYPKAWRLLVAEPESRAWLDQLSRSGYFTASPDDYARDVAAHRAELARLLP